MAKLNGKALRPGTRVHHASNANVQGVVIRNAEGFPDLTPDETVVKWDRTGEQDYYQPHELVATHAHTGFELGAL